VIGYSRSLFTISLREAKLRGGCTSFFRNYSDPSLLKNHLTDCPNLIDHYNVVLVETLWTLKGKKYQLNKTDLIAVIRALFKEPTIRFENGQVVWLALKHRQVNHKSSKSARVSCNHSVGFNQYLLMHSECRAVYVLSIVFWLPPLRSCLENH
jgi:hypothetical protein